MTDGNIDSTDEMRDMAYNRAAQGVNPPAISDPSTMGRGYVKGDNAYTDSMMAAAEQRGSVGNVAQSAAVGMAKGLANGVNPQIVDPVANFMSGVAAGLGIPASIAQAKKDQIKSTLDATPLAITMPALAARYPNLASLPSALAMQTIQKIAADTAVMIQRHNEKVGAPVDVNGNPITDQSNPLGEDESEAINTAKAYITEHGSDVVTEANAPALITGINASMKATGYTGPALQSKDIVGSNVKDWDGYISTGEDAQKNSRLDLIKKHQDDVLWAQFSRTVNPVVAMRGSPLGTIGVNNMRALRAKLISGSPMTSQDLANVSADIAGVMQGSAPHVEEIKANGYGNIYTAAANNLSYFAGNPIALEDKGIRSRLLDQLNGLISVDQDMTAKNLDTQAIAYQGITKDDAGNDTPRYLEFKKHILAQNYGGPAGGATSTSNILAAKVADGATGKAADGTPVIRKNGVWVPRQ